MIKDMDVYQFRNKPLFPYFYFHGVLLYGFLIGHHYLCQFQF